MVKLAPANFTANPTRFPASRIDASAGCAGTQSNCAAAKGKYVPYQAGGSSVVCLGSDPLLGVGSGAGGGIIGPARGHAATTGCPTSVGLGRPGVPAPMKGGGCGCAAETLIGGRRRRRRRSRRKRTRRRTKRAKRRRRTRGRRGRRRKAASRKRHRRSFHRGSISKTHSGKDFETRKTSKRYNEKRWSKYLWHGRHTLPAPDFPFVGGGSRRRRRHRGGKRRQKGGEPQPYSNEPISFSQAIPGTTLGPNESALANPPPYRAEYNCELNNFPHQK